MTTPTKQAMERASILIEEWFATHKEWPSDAQWTSALMKRVAHTLDAERAEVWEEAAADATLHRLPELTARWLACAAALRARCP